MQQNNASELSGVDFLLGETLPPVIVIQDTEYRIKTKIGKGTFGMCYLYENKAGDKGVCAKISSSKYLTSGTGGFEATLLDRYQREVRMMKRLHHENIVQFYLNIQVDNLRIIFMEYHPTDLQKELIRYIKLDVARVRNIMRDTLNGLDYIHGLDIIHRDIKLANILLSFNGRAIICDFGGARDVSDGHVVKPRGQTSGTLAYMAPELLQDVPTLTTKVDIWGAGVVMFNLLVGRAPFRATDRNSAYTRIKNCLVDIPIGLEELHGGRMARQLLMRLMDERYLIRPTARNALDHLFFLTDFEESIPAFPEHFKPNRHGSDIQRFFREQLKQCHRDGQCQGPIHLPQEPAPIWLIDYHRDGLKAGLAYVMSDGRTGFLFMNRISARRLPNGQKTTWHTADGALMQNKPRSAKRRIFRSLLPDLCQMYQYSFHAPMETTDEDTFVEKFFINRDVAIFLFTNRSIQVNFVSDQVSMSMLITEHNVHLFRYMRYYTLQRNWLPEEVRAHLMDIIGKIK